jgi:hypothetical protein
MNAWLCTIKYLLFPITLFKQVFLKNKPFGGYNIYIYILPVLLDNIYKYYL